MAQYIYRRFLVETQNFLRGSLARYVFLRGLSWQLDFALYSVEFVTFVIHVSEREFSANLVCRFWFSIFCKPVTVMATSVSTKVLILGHSCVRRLVTNLQRECVDRALGTFNVSGVVGWMYMYGCMELADGQFRSCKIVICMRWPNVSGCFC